MKLTIINVANKMPEWVTQACNEYLKRINHGKYTCKIIEIKPNKNKLPSVAENKEYEAKKIKTHISENSFVIVLDEKGKKINSAEFAHKLEKIALNYAEITFVIGGADGIHPSLYEAADLMLQLSDLTFPHAMVRIILLEQLYRAITILENHPYHRE